METKDFEFRPTKEGARSKSPGVIGRLSNFARSKTRHSLNEKTSNSTTYSEKPKKVLCHLSVFSSSPPLCTASIIQH
ncbi:unnamed protein product [Nippostrongylus brasiliensis]|uniref:APC membrane recruitment protein 1 n=1 Tax=Nippostrongylus brasiliensis TaxID=27835 RepID=A0A0N4Y1V3_NIPBR|nr:unnamed protein product [Nippostrongylus brasiliensis]